MHVRYWKEIGRDRWGVAGLVITALIFITAFAGPAFLPGNAADYSGSQFQPPSAEHLLGTNDVGQDVALRIVLGARTSLTVAVLVSLMAALLSVLFGALPPMAGKKIDRITVRIIDAFLAIPAIIVIILISAYTRPGTFMLVPLISLMIWPQGARIIRAQTLSLMERGHIKSARTFGAGILYTVRRHIVPDMGPVTVSVMIHSARRAVFMEAGLSFLGIGDSATVSWGSIINHAMGFTYLPVWKWWLLPAGIALSATITGLFLIGYSLETILDPRLRQTGHE